MSCHNKDMSCFQVASLGSLCLSDRLDSFDMVSKFVDMVSKFVDMVSKFVDMVVLVYHDNELGVDDVAAGNSVGIHIEKDID
jgi:hypothetical protein